MLPKLSGEQVLEQLRLAIVIRRFEEELIKLAGSRDIGHFHVYIGQEMTGVPALYLLERGDLSFTTHRNHGHLLARGVPASQMYAEILGKETGMMGGRPARISGTTPGGASVCFHAACCEAICLTASGCCAATLCSSPGSDFRLNNCQGSCSYFL